MFAQGGKYIKKNAQMLFGIIFLLFISPIILEFFSNSTQQEVFSGQPSGKHPIIAEQPEEKQVVPTPTNQNINIIEQTPQNKTVLVLFTHSHEAFEPIVKSKNGLAAVYHPTTNITEFKDTIKNHFGLDSIKTEFLAVDTMDEMKKNNRDFAEAYDVIRPFLATELQKKEYDLIIDLHRDSATRKITSLTYNNQSYAKLYFVVGEDHPNFKMNKSYAEHLSNHLNEMVPGISRGVIGKKGDNVDGIYNQDLAKNMVLIELGGIGNTQDEINRTISVLAKATSIVLHEIPL
jgi:stage II sporulation protein P